MFTTQTLPQSIIAQKKLITSFNPKEHGFSYDPKKWSNSALAMRNYPECDELLEELHGYITRGTVMALANSLVDKPSEYLARKFFFSVMLWGWSDKGVGIPRTDWVYEHNTEKNIATNVLSAMDALKINRNMLLAFTKWNVPYCKLSFMTKVFYFLGSALKMENKPLILDKTVINNLHKLGLDVTQFANGKIDKNSDYQLKDINNDSAMKYLMYVTTLNYWAIQLGVTPDAIEMYLFTIKI